MANYDGFYDPTDKPYNTGYNIEFTHISSGRLVKFKAWLTDFSDDYESNWNSEEVYGRMDPIQTFHSTKRTINLAWDVVAASEAEAIKNMEDATTLFQMLYPNYSGHSLKSPPLLRLKFLNLVQDVSNKKKGIVGTVSGFSFAPDIEQGFFDHGQNPGVVYPQTLKMQCTFTCLHSHELGYGDESRFPYNMHKETPDPVAPHSPEDAQPPAPDVQESSRMPVLPPAADTTTEPTAATEPAPVVPPPPPRSQRAQSVSTSAQATVEESSTETPSQTPKKRRKPLSQLQRARQSANKLREARIASGLDPDTGRPK